MTTPRPRSPWRVVRPRVAWVVILIGCLGCPLDDDGDDDGAHGTEATETANTGDTAATDGSEETTEASTTADTPWADVPCGEVMCTGSEICVQPGDVCDYSGCDEQDGDAVWVTPEPYCVPFPEDCPYIPTHACLHDSCERSEPRQFDDGLLVCWGVDLDCWCHG